MSHPTGDSFWNTNSHQPILATVTLLPRTNSADSTDTADDQPGPGRGLDKLFQFLGRRLERSLNSFALRLGYGPAAAERMVNKAMDMLDYPEKRVSRRKIFGRWTRDEWTKRELAMAEKSASRACRRLLKYLQSSPPPTQLRILLLLAEIKSTHPTRMDTLFKKYGAWQTILAIHSYLELITMSESTNTTAASALWHAVYDTDFNRNDLDGLLAASRKALYCVEDSELNRLAKRVWEMRVSADKMNPARAEQFYAECVSPCFAGLLQYLMHPELSFLSLRYISQLFICRVIHIDVVAELCLKIGVLLRNNVKDRCCRQDHLKSTRTCLLLVYDEEWIEEKSGSAQTYDDKSNAQSSLSGSYLAVETSLLKSLAHSLEFALRRKISIYYGGRKSSVFVPWERMDERFAQSGSLMLITQICNGRHGELTRQESSLLLKMCHEIDRDNGPMGYDGGWTFERKKVRERRLLGRMPRSIKG